MSAQLLTLAGALVLIVACVLAAFGWLLPEDKDLIVGLVIGAPAGAAIAAKGHGLAAILKR